MGKNWIAVQLAAGRGGPSSSEPDEIDRCLVRARDLARADAVILQPPPEPGRAEAVVEAARRAGLEVVLWFPVLSDSPGAPSGLPTLNADESRGNGRSGAWEGLAGGAESFLFRCPNDEHHLRAVGRTFQSLLDSLDPDAVMLDKIRFPSPSNGFEALFSCFCDSCRAAFLRATGHSMDEVRRASLEFLGLLSSRGPSTLEGRWTGPGTFWDAAGLGELAAFRAGSVQAVVRDLAGVARARSVRVGLDLFSPSVAPLVGQDYGALSSLCDWIKPMTYRAAVGPAGLPLEVASLWKALQELHPLASGEIVRDLLGQVFQWELSASASDLVTRGLPASVISRELAAARNIPLARSTRIFAGIEAVQIPEFGIHVSPQDLEASLLHAQGLADGIVVSWDLLRVPEENLRRIGAAMQ